MGSLSGVVTQASMDMSRAQNIGSLGGALFRTVAGTEAGQDILGNIFS
jgi:hypothetical protein